MKKAVLVAAALLFTGCASHPIRQDAQDKIHVGDSIEQLRAVMGEPTEVGPNSQMLGATNWFYVNGGDICGFTVKEEVVKAQACFDNPDYVSPGRKIAKAVGTVLAGAGQGLQNSSRQQVTCDSYDYGSYIQTKCR